MGNYLNEDNVKDLTLIEIDMSLYAFTIYSKSHIITSSETHRQHLVQ